MHLAAFLEALFINGSVQVTGDIASFEPDDLESSRLVLHRFYERDVLDMPGIPPAFEPEAALWSAAFLYHSIQLVLLRHLGEDAIHEYLKPYDGTASPAAIYSADLCLLQLPNLLSLAKALAPDDPLVLHLKETLKLWPFSAAEIDLLQEAGIAPVLKDPCLQRVYIDRIIDSGNIKKASREPIQTLVRETLGDHASLLWPEFSSIS